MYLHKKSQLHSLILAGLCMLLIHLPVLAFSKDTLKNVVIFFAYDPNLPAFEKILNGLSETIRGNSREPVNILTEYLDLNRAVNDTYSSFIINMYNGKVEEITIDLLITVGPGINAALLKYGNPKLLSLPMINIDLNIPNRITVDDVNHGNGKEILLKFNIEKTFQHAFELFPDNKNVVVISGVSGLDNFYVSLIKKSISQFEPDYSFTFISGLSLDTTIRYCRSIPPKSLVFVPSFLQDAGKISYSTPEVVELISKNSLAPVFLGVTDGGFEARGGGIGGYLFSYYKLGQEIGRMAEASLKGKSMKDIEVHEDDFYAYLYDWNELKRWHLEDSKGIPAKSIYYNRKVSFFDLYKWYFLGALVFMVSQTMLILYLFRLNKRQKQINIKIQETESMHRELIHTDRLSKMALMTASLSHELFQPLAAIRLTAQAGKQFVLSEKLDRNNATQMFEHILEDESRATKLIRSVKNLMKSESTEKERLSLNVLIDETVELIRADAEREAITISIVFEDDHVFVIGDKIQLQQVLMNFIRNAIAAMAKGGNDGKRLDILLRHIKNEAIVSVKDTGPGLDSTVKENLFKPFISTKKDGFGIGLALCKSLIEKHDGKIWAENDPEGGARFSFSLHVLNPA